MNRPSLIPVLHVLTWCLHLLVAGLLVLAAGRALAEGAPDAVAVTVTCLLLGLCYAAGPALRSVGSSPVASALWLALLGAGWLVLLLLTEDAVWLAFPLFFLQLHLLPRRAGLSAVAATTVAAVTGFSLHQGSFTLATAVGPALGAAVAVATALGYQALYRESEARRALIEELSTIRADLAAANHVAGVTAERERLAREIHDTLAQGLSSIQLLLRAAERALPPEPGPAGAYVRQARRAAQDNLSEVRHFVAGLTPPGLEGTTLVGALERLCATTSARHDVPVRFHLSGSPAPMPVAHEVALLRIAQSALANAMQHARPQEVEVTLSHMDTQVALDVVDDGVGFRPEEVPPTGSRDGGFGLATMRSRVRTLGGTLTVESAPGAGTALAVQLPAAAEPAATRRRGAGSAAEADAEADADAEAPAVRPSGRTTSGSAATGDVPGDGARP